MSLIFSSSSSSSSSEDEEAISNEYNELEQTIEYVVHTHVPQLLSAAPRRQRRFGHRRYLNRDREAAHIGLMKDYFAPNPVYPAEYFRRRFRMHRHVFVRIIEALQSSDSFFQRRRDGAGRLGHSAEQKCTAAIRMLAYGTAADAFDEYLKMSKDVARVSLEKFTEGIIYHFGTEYLRRPTAGDLERLLQMGEQRGFPGMMGSIDCMHWEWKNCPAAWKGQYVGRSGKATLILEAAASQDLWIWHAFFGIPGSCNDLNVLYRSPVFDDILNGRAPPVKFKVKNREFNMGYYLTDGIYPPWASFIQTINLPQTRKHKLFAEKQESARKDIERAFGVLQSRFHIVRKPSLAWDEDILWKIMMACIIMHNMIVEDERDTYGSYIDFGEFDDEEYDDDDDPAVPVFERIVDINQYLSNRDDLRDTNEHETLKKALIENIWEKYGNAS